MKPKREAVVALWRPHSDRGKIIARFTTVRAAEKFIAEREKTDPKGVARGDYSIDASPAAEAEYQRS